MICSVIGGFGVISDHCNPYFREYMVTLVNTVNEIIALGYNTFMSEIVNECDRSFFDVINAFRRQIGNVYIEGGVPYQCKSQATLQEELEKECNKVHRISEIVAKRANANISHKYMIDISDATLFIWNGKKQGDIWNEIKYAREIGKQIFYINYSEFKGNVRIFS